MSMNLEGFRPMKSAAPDQDFDWGTLFQQGESYLVSPKYDGWRCVIHPTLGPVSNTLKPIANEYTRNWLKMNCPSWLDGELVVNPITHPNQMQLAQSAFSSQGGTPDFRYMVFDNFEAGNMCGFGIRVEDAKTVTEVTKARHLASSPDHPWRIELAPQHRVDSVEELLALEEKYLAEGYEGVMIRSLDGKYKYGRSTLKQRGMIKMKRYIDAEAEVIGWEPLYRNTNDAVIDNLGLQKRGYSKDGKVADDTRVGKLRCRAISGRFAGSEFSIGSGFDDSARVAMREAIWLIDNGYDPGLSGNLPPDYPIGKIMTFKYQDHGSKDTVRQPIFKSWRSSDDITHG